MPRRYIDLIKLALSQVAPEFFRIRTTYNHVGIVRERVFCYELYHQIRSNMQENHALSIHGEIDKSGHHDFLQQDRLNPDFVFHFPGTHEGNTLVVEVKGSLRDSKGLIKDFNTLLTFVGNYHYAAGVFILYNHSINELIERIGRALEKIGTSPYASSVFIITIQEPLAECNEFALSSLNAPTD